MQKWRDFNLVLPSHIKTTLSNLRAFRDEVDLVICVSDARAHKTTDVSSRLKEIFPKSKILNLISKADLVPCAFSNAFNFKKQENRKHILNLIKDTLGRDRDSFRKLDYMPHYQVFVIGFPNVGKSTLINLLKNKKVSNSENYPGVTKKITKYYLGDNLWLYDSPGIFTSSCAPLDKLFCINAIPATINDCSNFLEQAYLYLFKNYFELLRGLVDEDFYDYSSFILSLAKKNNCKVKGGDWDLDMSEKKFLGIIRGHRLKVFWDLD